ncbi:MAG: hypothetical protein K2N60_09000 [Oscillospiraceae bacterium]|nr:hypothetical protein [Oscillospiraceae bacterium]
MKNFANKFTAVLAAVMMTVSAAGISVCALAPISWTYIGWEQSPNGWTYTYVEFDEEPYREIDGVMYDFDPSDKYVCSGKHSGWTDYNGIKKYRYYHDGLPYTGWTKSKSGKRKYFLDGFPVKGDFRIGDKLYSFDKKGIYTGKSEPAVLTASCGESISADAEKISITVKYNDGNDNISYTIGEPAKMERWENGEWEICGKPSEYALDDIAYDLGGLGDCSVNFTNVAFYPHRYMDGDMPEGYYRVVVPCSYGETKKDLYAVFKAVSPVEVKMSEDIYAAEADADIDLQTYITVNSEKLAGKDISLKIEKKTNSGWETAVKEFKFDKDASCDSVSADGTITAGIGMPPETGYYRAVVTVGKKSYEAAFRVEVS